MTWRELTAEELNSLKKVAIIDVRSPCEFAIEHIPQAVNVPLFTDQEREIIGTIYAQEGESVARRKALVMVAPKIPQLLDEILSHRVGGAPLVIHCWRGGLRSEAVASCLSIIGVDCWRLTGGFKAWRKELLSEFEDDQYAFSMVVLHGHTGVGKTEILQHLCRLGHSVLDLEALANHRGSVFGAMKLGSQPTQKNFDAMVWQAVRSFPPGVVFVEAEGKKVGKLSLPLFVYGRMESAARVLVEGSLESRVKRIIDEYTENNQLSSQNLESALHSLEAIKGRLGGEKLLAIKQLLGESDYAAVVKILLQDYYDPMYARGIVKYEPYELTVSGDDAATAALQIATKFLVSV